MEQQLKRAPRDSEEVYPTRRPAQSCLFFIADEISWATVQLAKLVTVRVEEVRVSFLPVRPRSI
jgi:hypothetical protein